MTSTFNASLRKIVDILESSPDFKDVFDPLEQKDPEGTILTQMNPQDQFDFMQLMIDFATQEFEWSEDEYREKALNFFNAAMQTV